MQLKKAAKPVVTKKPSLQGNWHPFLSGPEARAAQIQKK